MNHRTASVLTLILICISLALPGCSAGTATPAPGVAPIQATQTPLSTAVSATLPASASPQPAPSPTAAPQPSITPSPVPDPLRETPATLMLHRGSYQFDALQFLKDFIVVFKQSGLRVTTYRELANRPDLSLGLKGRLFIFTIDDIYLRYPIDPNVLAMIGLLREAGYPAVLGVITEGNYAYPQTVATLNDLQAQGWEIASHSDTHTNLAEIEKVAPRSVYPEIKTSLDKLQAVLGLRPITLILPEGQMTRGEQQIIRSAVLWVVGIGGGTQYDNRRPYYYVGREGPDGSAAQTLVIMLKRFAP